jgi:cell shape-determining protein MreC
MSLFVASLNLCVLVPPQAFKNILAKTPFKSTDLFELMKLNNQLSERLEFIYDTDLVYKLASVVYFDEKENPEDYDWTYNQKKIDKWKKDKSINDFF